MEPHDRHRHRRAVPDHGPREDLFTGVAQEAATSERAVVRGNLGLYYRNHDLDSLVVVKGSVAVFVVARSQTARRQLDQIASGILANVV